VINVGVDESELLGANGVVPVSVGSLTLSAAVSAWSTTLSHGAMTGQKIIVSIWYLHKYSSLGAVSRSVGRRGRRLPNTSVGGLSE
jgi:hypothetical protein